MTALPQSGVLRVASRPSGARVRPPSQKPQHGDVVTAAAAVEDAASPLGLLHIDANPWAEVWIDGSRVGETPLGNVPLHIGTHRVILRHPQLGERRQIASVTVDGPTHINVDMKQR